MPSHFRVLADENIPLVHEAFGAYGAVETLPGHGIRRSDVQDADVLLVRSVTSVGADLLDGSSVRFVGSATIGTDHVDVAYLKDRGIAFAHAPGSNATSVVEYVLAALFQIAAKRDDGLRGKTVGIVGYGNIGSRLAARLPAFGVRVLKNDPPLAEAAERAGTPHDFIPLDDLLAASDIVTLHVPLTRTGPHATRHLINASTLARMKAGAWLVNTCRGSVVDNAALLPALQEGRLGAAMLDVWENEPTPDAELVRLVDLGTPHIAGYSYDGKIQGTVMMYEAFLRHFGVEPVWNPESAFAPTDEDRIDVRLPDPTLPEPVWFNALIRQLYDIAEDDRHLRSYLEKPPAERGRYFNRLRKQYPRRRTFGRYDLPDDIVPPSYVEAVRQGLLLGPEEETVSRLAS